MSKKQRLMLTLILILIITSIGGGYWWTHRSTDDPHHQVMVDGTNISPAVSTTKGFYQSIIANYPHLKKSIDHDTPPTTYQIPGLIRTKTLVAGTTTVTTATDMDPQGLAITKDYLIISAYSRHKKNNSVLYFLSKKTGNYVKQIVLPTNSHVGGIAYDPVSKRLWLTTQSGQSQATLSAYNHKTLATANFKTTHQATKFDHVVSLPNIPRSSFIAYHHNTLYTGYFSKTTQGKFISYPLSTTGMPRLSSRSDVDLRGKHLYGSSYTTNKQLQGVTFYQGQIMFSQSFGNTHSNLLTFDNDGQKTWLDFDNDDILKKIALPPYLEQIVTDGSDLYVLFESGAAHYRSQPLKVHADRVMKLDLKSLLGQ
mgnify:CR=1 FL=1